MNLIKTQISFMALWLHPFHIKLVWRLSRFAFFVRQLRLSHFLIFGELNMRIYRVTFIGHRCIEREYELENKIEEIIKDLIRTKEYVELYMGRNGDFDISAASAVKRAQKALGKHNSSLILVEPYSMKTIRSTKNIMTKLYCLSSVLNLKG